MPHSLMTRMTPLSSRILFLFTVFVSLFFVSSFIHSQHNPLPQNHHHPARISTQWRKSRRFISESSATTETASIPSSPIPDKEDPQTEQQHLKPQNPPPSEGKAEKEEEKEKEEVEEEEITSSQIKSLKKKIQETQKLIASITKETEQINKEIKQLEEQYGDQIETITQDFQRLKQRSYQETKEVAFRAKSDALKEVFPVSDSFFQYKQLYSQVQNEKEKAIAKAYEVLFDGVEDIIHSFGAKRLSTLGTSFNVDIMDAIMTAPSTEYKAGLVCAEFQYGYEMEGRCIRPAMVSVSDGPGPAE